MAASGESSTLTIIATPTANNSTEVLSAYLPIVFDVESSEPSVLTKFVKAEVQYGSSNTTISTIKKEEITDGGTDLFRFEVSKLLQTVLSSELLTMATHSTVQTGGDNIANTFRIVFTQIYIDDFGNTIEQDTAISSSYWVGNSTVQYTDTQNLLDYIATSTSSKFLTNIPNESVLNSTDDVQLAFYVPNDTDTYAMYYEEYDLAGAAQGTTTTTGKTLDNRYGILPINSAGVLSNFANMSKVDVWVYNVTTAAQVSEKKTFITTTFGCDGERIMWMNSLGGIDQYTFKASKKVGHKLERIGMKKPLSLSYTRSSRGLSTIGSSMYDSWVVSSSYLTEEYILWLNEILVSTNVDLVVSVNVLNPIVVTTENMISYDKFELVDFTLNFDMARERITHIG